MFFLTQLEHKTHNFSLVSQALLAPSGRHRDSVTNLVGAEIRNTNLMTCCLQSDNLPMLGGGGPCSCFPLKKKALVSWLSKLIFFLPLAKFCMRTDLLLCLHHSCLPFPARCSLLPTLFNPNLPMLQFRQVRETVQPKNKI